MEQARDAVDTSQEQAIGLYSEARSVGVIGNSDRNPSPDGIIEALKSALSWNPQTLPDDDGSRISLLEEELSQLRQDRRDVQTRIDAARQFAKRAGGYESEAAEHRPAGLDQGPSEGSRERGMAMAVQRREPCAGISGCRSPAQRVGIARQGTARRNRAAPEMEVYLTELGGKADGIAGAIKQKEAELTFI